jgi:actin-related protein
MPESVVVGCIDSNVAGGGPRRGVSISVFVAEHGVVQSWEDMQLLWEHAFEHELCSDPADRPVFLYGVIRSAQCLSKRTVLCEFLFRSIITWT